ncbi:UNVERIFIED_ORG: adenylate cyclase [Rhizobium aethiopicum]
MNELRSLAAWIIDKGICSSSIEEILLGASERLVALGYPVMRLSILMPSLDPTQRGFSISWSSSTGVSTEITTHGTAGQKSFERSPVFYLLSNELQFARWKLSEGEDKHPYPILSELREQGATDYVLKLISFPGEAVLVGMGFSMAADGPQGFSQKQIDDLDMFLPALGLACYRIAATRTATEMLAVYTGPRTSGRILSGQTARGEGTAIYAAILLADLKNFSALSEVYGANRIVAWLNEHFEAIGGAVEANGGEILKFMGDSVLSIFPADLDMPANACKKAFVAAQMAHTANDNLNRRRLAAGGPELLVDVVLHVGEIFYGNVGSPRRLDFTAIGKAVNEAARIERLCDAVGRRLLVSESFANHFEGVFEKVGTFTLRGIAAAADVYGTMPHLADGRSLSASEGDVES